MRPSIDVVAAGVAVPSAQVLDSQRSSGWESCRKRVRCATDNVRRADKSESSAPGESSAPVLGVVRTGVKQAHTSGGRVVRSVSEACPMGGRIDSADQERYLHVERI